MKHSHKVVALLLLVASSHGQVNTDCLEVTHSCKSRSQACDEIEAKVCSSGETKIETIWLSAKICNWDIGIERISNPESLVTIFGPAALEPTGRTDPILVPFPDGMTHLFPGQCAEVKDFEFDIDLCQNGFNYEVSIETDSDCKGYKSISTMVKYCNITSDVECSLVNEGIKCEDVHDAGYSMLDCIQDVRYDFSYSNQNGNEKDVVIFDMIKFSDVNDTNSNYTAIAMDGTIIQVEDDNLEDIATGDQFSFSHIVHNVNICENIPNATLKTFATPLALDQSKRNDYKRCYGSTSYLHITREAYPSIVPISFPPIMESFPPTFLSLVPQTSAPSARPSSVPTLRKHSKGGKKKTKRGKAKKKRKVPRKL